MLVIAPSSEYFGVNRVFNSRGFHGRKPIEECGWIQQDDPGSGSAKVRFAAPHRGSVSRASGFVQRPLLGQVPQRLVAGLLFHVMNDNGHAH